MILKDHRDSNARESLIATWINLVMWNALDKSWFDLFFSFIYFINLKIGHFWWSNIWKYFKIPTMRSYKSFPKTILSFSMGITLKLLFRQYIKHWKIYSTNIYDPCTQKSSSKMAFSRWKSRFSVFSEGSRSFLRKWKYTNQTQIVDWTSKTSKIIFACSAYQNSYS